MLKLLVSAICSFFAVHGFAMGREFSCVTTQDLAPRSRIVVRGKALVVTGLTPLDGWPPVFEKPYELTEDEHYRDYSVPGIATLKMVKTNTVKLPRAYFRFFQQGVLAFEAIFKFGSAPLRKALCQEQKPMILI